MKTQEFLINAPDEKKEFLKKADKAIADTYGRGGVGRLCMIAAEDYADGKASAGQIVTLKELKII